MLKFEIDKPAYHTNWLILSIKYFTFFIILWIANIIIVLGVIQKNTNFGIFVDENLGTITFLTALAAIFYIGFRINKKYRLGNLFEITFDDDNKCLSLLVINSNTNAISLKKINYADLKIVSYTHTEDTHQANKILGNQRIIKIYNRSTLVNTLHIEMTAWCRHHEIEYIIEKLNTVASLNRKDLAPSSSE
jgi:hypothetical protein